MDDKDDLVIVFVPPLAEMLARSELLKGSPLTEGETIKIRDSAACVKMERSRSEELTTARGYRDVSPSNCWADWHRLRSQMTGKGYLPKIVMCLLGDASFGDRCAPFLDQQKIEYEITVQDPRMVRAFVHSASPLDSCMEDSDMKLIPQHASVLYMISDNYTAAEGPGQCLRFLQIGTHLLANGGIAMKCDSSGIAHGREHWVQLSRDAARSDGSPPFWYALLRAFVQWPIQSESDLFTCGMHLLGHPDLIVSEDILRPLVRSEELLGSAAVDLFGAFAMYVLAECAPGEFCSGSTFSAAVDSPRFRVNWEACAGYEEDEYFFNPFGRWRFTST